MTLDSGIIPKEIPHSVYSPGDGNDVKVFAQMAYKGRTNPTTGSSN
jgi:hypothetical protein